MIYKIKNILIFLFITIVFLNDKQIYSTIQMMDQVRIIDLETLGIQENILTEFGSTDDNTPHFVALDEINGYWFVTTIASGFVAQYSLVDNSFIDAYFVGDAPALLAVDPHNQKIYCSRMMPMNGMGDMMPSGESNIVQGLSYSPVGLSENITLFIFCNI